MEKTVEIIQFEGDNSSFIWKHPCEDFSLKSQLLVHESQEAIFMLNGQALDSFGPGKHCLTLDKIPFLAKVRAAFNNEHAEDKDNIHCEIYFINKTVQMAIKWGTDSKVHFIDPTTGLPLEIGACGELNLQVINSRSLLLKLVGTMKGIAWEDTAKTPDNDKMWTEHKGYTMSIKNAFRPLIVSAVKSNLPNIIKDNNIDIFEIDSKLDIISEELRKVISAGFEEYGLSVPQFYVTNILYPEDDPNFKKLRELHTISLQTKFISETRKVALEQETTETEILKRQAERDLIRAQTESQATRLAGMAEADVMAAKGYTQKDVLTAEVQKAYAEGIGNMNISGGAGSVAGDMIGLGVGLAAANTVTPKIGEMFGGANGNQSSTCSKCGAQLPNNAKFCLECGEKVSNGADFVICPECGKKVAKGKFCPECGHKFVTTCPKCGASTHGGKFCLECGEKL